MGSNSKAKPPEAFIANGWIPLAVQWQDTSEIDTYPELEKLLPGKDPRKAADVLFSIEGQCNSYERHRVVNTENRKRIGCLAAIRPGWEDDFRYLMDLFLHDKAPEAAKPMKGANRRRGSDSIMKKIAELLREHP